MTIEENLLSRSQSSCELCSSTDKLSVYVVAPKEGDHSDNCVLLCSVCQEQIASTGELEQNHWRSLSDSMWSPIPAVQVMAWRMLKRLSIEPWAQDLLDMLYLDEELLAWAESAASNDEAVAPTLDSNGTALAAGDNVTVIKDLQVKGTSFTAKRGTVVRGISLTNNPEHIEGRVNGTRIVLLSCYLKKS
jgi:protein PhnA